MAKLGPITLDTLASILQNPGYGLNTLRELINAFELLTVNRLDNSTYGLAAIKAAIASIAGGAFYGSYGPKNVEVDNDVDLGMILYDPSGNIITTGEITPGTYTIHRVRGGADTEVVGSTPSLEAAGRVFITYSFPALSWQVGDVFYVTFSGIAVAIGGVTTEYPDLYIWGRVVREADVSAKVDAVEAKLDDGTAGLAALKILIDALQTSTDRQLFCVDFWSDPQDYNSVHAVPANMVLPDLLVAGLPAGATVVRAIAMFKFRIVANSNVAANQLDGATVPGVSQVIQVRKDGVGTWRDAINFADNQFSLSGSTREGGDVCIGNINIAVEVDGDDDYNFQWLQANADLDTIDFYDIQVGLRIWYAV